MGIKPENVQMTGFEVLDKGLYQLFVEKVEFKYGKAGEFAKSGQEKSTILSCAVTSKSMNSDHGNSLDVIHVDRFYNINEPEDGQFKAAGLKRLLYFLIKSFKYPLSEANFDHFVDEKEQAKITAKIPGKKFGADVKHKTGKNQDGTPREEAYIDEYYSEAEIKELLKAAKGGNAAAPAASAPAAAATGDGW